ncbi:helix-turn-helix domain-containing protein [Nocardioides convexus]|uniref:PucR family transcriptional regulator n=1 Tax=Nocardioides convexus TaxID=2712224 RepID=UPI002418AF6B|nr:helix-turn-helix domain-containing protein [Nocardioides convexus]
MRAAGARQRLTVVAAASTLWVWLPVRTPPDRAEVAAALRRTPEVRVAIGAPARGVEGFRRSHQDAVEVRRLVARLGAPDPVVTFAEVQVAALVTRDEARAEEFVALVLGDLAAAPADLQETVRTYLAVLGNASAAADRLFTHRNTVLRRLARADEPAAAPAGRGPAAGRGGAGGAALAGPSGDVIRLAVRRRGVAHPADAHPAARQQGPLPALDDLVELLAAPGRQR